MHIHIRVHHWVLWWIYVGIVCGIVASVNVLDRNLSPVQIKVVIIIGALFWLLGGLACYGYDGVRIEIPPAKKPRNDGPGKSSPQREWHYASEFVLPGSRKGIFPRR